MRTGKFILIIAILSVVILSCCPKKNESTLDYENYLKQNYQSPVDYIINKFKDHRIVMLGETHAVKHDPILIQQLIPKLYENGIYFLATEFARRKDQPLIDSLLNSKDYDENLARRITLQQYVFWGYQDYIDIYKAAWELNQSLPSDAKKFSILGLNNNPDWSILKKPGDEKIDSLRIKVWNGQTERDWSQVVVRKIFQNEKVLTYSGMHHAFSEFLQPIVSGDNKFIRFENERFGHYLFLRFGKDVFTIYLHATWENSDRSDNEKVLAAGGVIDRVMDKLGPEYYPIGFDINGSPFEDIIIDDAIYKYGYDPAKLGIYCDGWIFQKPLREYEVVTYIDDFINDSNIDFAQQQSPDPNDRDRTAESFNMGGKRTLMRIKEGFLKAGEF